MRRPPGSGWFPAPPSFRLLALKLPPPGGTLLALQLTVPLGALAEVGVLSVTVAVQLVGLPTGTVSGAQLTTVLVAWLVRATAWIPALLRCVVPPLDLPLMDCGATTARVQFPPHLALT